ncbi:trypsin-like cysteine/serine peptidase domain-containing protein [Ilyonectria destructans]|nr:trypsin-like cysteine/serine peptidase domain-containing protein [Ilyonectria destructans]
MAIDQAPTVSNLRDCSIPSSSNHQSMDQAVEKGNEQEPTVGERGREGGSKSVLLSEQESEAWQRAIETVVRSVVSVRFSQPYSFDTFLSKTSKATGFIVDAERGYVLTNRHVVGAGPFSGYIVFNNQEEVDAYPIYRDPVHDFGFLKFDPRAVKHMNLASIELRPDLAKVGVEIKVIGNDGGEKLGILSGFISRLDRNAPKYKGYMDFNTCYYQANASAAGGSSGSPVVNVDGHGIALQAGGRTDGASTDYFLPLDGPLRALRKIQHGEAVPRGEIQCVFQLKPFDECQRLGLSPEWETIVRDTFPSENNMLVAQTVLPQGPSDQKIKEGDILIKINGLLVTQFLRLNTIFDENVGRKLPFLLQRDGQDVEENILVQDLEEITPDCFLAVGGGSFHDLSYQVAQRYTIACRGVYVSESGPFHSTRRNQMIVQSISYKETPDLSTFMKDRHTLQTSVISIDRHWFGKMRMFKRNNITGAWDVDILAEALPAIPPAPLSASFTPLKHVPHRAVAEVVRSFVHVKYSTPILLDGQSTREKAGMGLVIDAQNGVVIVSRNIVPIKLCDIELTFADSVLVQGKVVFLHPSHHYVVIQYDPSLVDAPVQSVTLSPEQISQGASTLFVGHNESGQMVYTSTTVTRVMPLELPPPNPPKCRPINVDRIDVDSRLSTQCTSGVLMTENGTIQAIWLVYKREKDKETHFGLSSLTLLPVVTQLIQGIIPSLRSLPVELEAITMIQARVMGVSEEWIRQVGKKSSEHRLFTVKRAFSQLLDQLFEGDVLLTLNGVLITQLPELDVMYWKEALDAIIVRSGEQLSLQVQTVLEDDFETSHVANFCGLTVQKPHRTVWQSIKNLPSEVYITSWLNGSPANIYGLYATKFITHINHVPTPNLEVLVPVVASVPDRSYFTVKAVDYSGAPFVATIKKDERYFPTVEWIQDASHAEGWKRITYEEGKAIQGEGIYGITF